MSKVVGLLVTHTSLSPIRRGFTPGFVNYTKGALDLQLNVILAHCPVSSTTKTGRHGIAEILLKVVLNIKNNKSNCLQEHVLSYRYLPVFNSNL